MKMPDPSPVGLISPRFLIDFDFSSQVVIAVNQTKAQSFSLSLEVLDLSGRDHEKQALNRLVMVGARASHEIILDFTPAVVGFEATVFGGELALQFGQSGIDDGKRLSPTLVMLGDLDQSPMQEAGFECVRLTGRQFSPLRREAKNAHLRRLSGNRDLDVERMLLSPSDQGFRRVSPLQVKGRREHRLSMQHHREKPQKTPTNHPAHEGTMTLNPRKNKRRRRLRGGSVLLEVVYAMTALSALSLILFKLALNVTAPRQWVIQQEFSDVYLTYEKALAQRYPFNDLLANDSPWPAFPQQAEEQVVIGKLPGGNEVEGTVMRTRLPHPNNYPIDGGSGTLETNPAGMQVWNVQSILVYQINGREYAEARTVVRSQ